MSVLSQPRTDRDALSRFLVSFPAGAKIYAEGEVGTEMYAVRSGEVEITRRIAGKNRVLARLRKGDFFGETSILEDLPRESTARARTDVELIRVNGAAFEAMLKASPEIAVRMLRGLSRRLREAGTVERTPARPMAVPAQADRVRPTPAPFLDTDSDLCQLISAEGATRFILHREGDTVVGRADPVTQTAPDVDLTALDPQRSVSRRHARFYRIGTTEYVMEELGTANGTFVNDTRLATGVPAPIRSGDSLQLGHVALTFWDPSA